jgi:uncharacterized integral membrane protein
VQVTPGGGPQGGSASPATKPQARKRGRGRGIGISAAAAVLIFVTVVLVLFVMFNTQTVDVSLVFGNVDAPLVVALLIAAVLGGLVVAMAGIAMRARRKDR